MTVAQVAQALAEAMPRDQRDRPALKRGARCSITVGDVTANGTVRFGYSTPTRFVVRLDGTEQSVDVPLAIIGSEATT